MLNNIQRGTTWIVDLSSQYCTARRTKRCVSSRGCYFLESGESGIKKIEKVRERRQIIKRETLPLFPPLLLLFSNICRQGAEDLKIKLTICCRRTATRIVRGV